MGCSCRCGNPGCSWQSVEWHIGRSGHKEGNLCLGFSSIGFMDVIHLDCTLKSRGEEQDGVVSRWLREDNEEERSGWYCRCSGLHPACECGWLACYRSYNPVEGRESSWCMLSEAPGEGSWYCLQGQYSVGEVE